MTYGKWKALNYVPPAVEIPKEEVIQDVPKRVCKHCGKEFIVSHGSMLYCDSTCKYEVAKANQRAKYWIKKERMMADGKI